VLVTESAAFRLGLEPLAAALEHVPEGVAIFDAEWTIRFVNPVGAALLERESDELLGRNIWIALPELGGTIFHSFLLHARSVGGRVTWQGYYAPTARWLTATAVDTGEQLHLYFREAGGPQMERPAVGGPGVAADPDETVDRDRLRFLAEVSEAMISTLDTGESAAKLADLVVPRLCDWAVVSVVGEDGRPGEEARAHRDPERLADVDTYLGGRLRGTGDQTPLTAALLTGEPVQLRRLDPALVDPSLSTEEVRVAWHRLRVTSLTIVPLRARAETFGVLALMNTGDRPPHSEMEIAVAVEAVRRASLALDNARLYGRQLKVAETLQHSMLTPPPRPDHLEIAVRYRPAATNMHVGGDWYDAFQQPDGATLLVIGDVVGHNVDAAAAMGQIRSILRGIAYDRPESPARILARVDRVLTGLRIPAMATALVARVEQTDEEAPRGLRTLRWSSAGHLPPLLLRAGGAVEVLSSEAERLLGAESTRGRTDHQVLLEPGDTVVFYTDGIVEYGRSGIDEGIARLTAALRELPGLSVDELCDELLGRIVSGRTDDDVAILAVHCGTEGGPPD
jgi:sigma-B regulation protein RsbU (phosphoserine phosphatase)